MSKKLLSSDGKEQLALALLLLQDFKTQDIKPLNDEYLEVIKMIIGLAEFLDIRKEFDFLASKIPPMKIVPRV